MDNNLEKETKYTTDENGYIFQESEQQDDESFLAELTTDLESTNTDDIPKDMPPLVVKKEPTIAERKAQGQEKRKKIWPWILLSIIILLLAIAGGLFFWIETNDVKLVTLNGEQQIMTHVTPETFVDLYDNITVTFQENGESTSYTYKELDIQVTWSDSQAAMFEGYNVNLDNVYYYFNYSQKLRNIIHGLNQGRRDWAPAQFKETETDFVVISEVIGNKVDIDAVEQYVINNFALTDLVINLDDFKYPQPDYFCTDVEFRNEVFKWEEFKITYSNGFEITPADLKPYFMLTEVNTIVFDERQHETLKEQVWKWINEDLNSYNTLGGTFRFLTHDGQEVELTGVNYGDKMNKQAEHDFLMNVIANMWTCEDRIPEMTIDYPDDIQSNVIEVSLENQHLWYWQDGQVKMDTDIVTGWKNKWDTPKGVYRVLNKINGVYLIGEDYKTWVDKWMRFWEGYGLHDATWRNKFGDNIYARNGSHGCINLPHSFAVKLYDLVEPGDCVVIY